MAAAEAGAGEQGLGARRGAEMAIARVNEEGGIDGRPVELVVRSVEGLWGAGSKRIVSMAFEDGVWVILSSLDGRGAHLTEQVVTKALVPMVSLRASDPTLTQLYTPWFFRCVPDDRQQARALVREIFRSRSLGRVATMAVDTYDSRMAAATFARVAAAAGYRVSARLSYEGPGPDLAAVLRRIERDGIEGLVLFVPAGPTATIIRAMRARGMRQALFGPLSLADDVLLQSAGSDLEGAVLVAPGHWGTSRGETFRQAFRAIYGYPPSTASACAYDAMRVIVEAIERVGLDRAKIRDALSDIDYREGVTGRVRFDDKGNRVGDVELIEIVGGRPRFLHRAASDVLEPAGEPSPP